ncbi:MAG: hypothetical protein JWQ09_3534 [Segetibacter sp.]|nr:hypothetical protein [Segetibacter sp.]
MQKIIISDTSCLITLDKINLLIILKNLFKVVTITSLIAQEFGTALPDFIQTIEPSQSIFQKILQMNIDAGEASAIALSLEYKDPLVIIDDLKARKIAEELKLNITGTLGVLIEARKKGFINNLSTVLKELAKTNFRLTDELIQHALKMAGE